MGSFRVGQVASALSGGIGEILNVKMQEEQQRLERQWQLTLQNMADRRQQAGFEHSERLAAEREAGATARHAETQARMGEQADATALFRESQLTADESRFSRSRVDEARARLDKTLLELEKGMREELENPMVGLDENARGNIQRRYTDLKDQAIVGHVAWLSSQNLPGYEVENAEGLQSLLIQSGMDVAGAKDHSGQIWKSISGENLFNEPIAEDPAFTPSMPPYLPDPNDPNKRINNPDYVGSQSQPAAPQPGGPTIAPPTVQAPAPGGAYVPRTPTPANSPLDVGSAAGNLFEASGARRWHQEKFMPWWMGSQ